MFKVMTSALDKNKTPSPEEIQKIPSFIFCRWLSGNPIAIQAANEINTYHKIPIENQYWMIKHLFAGNIKYIPYPKNVSEKELKKVEWVADYFKINFEKARECIELMDPAEINNIVQMYTEQELKKGK